DGAEDREPDRRVAFRSRHQHGFLGRRSRAVIGVIVPVAEKNAVVVLTRSPREVPDERGARRAFGIEPCELVGDGVGLTEDPFRTTRELVRTPLAPDTEASNVD